MPFVRFNIKSRFQLSFDNHYHIPIFAFIQYLSILKYVDLMKMIFNINYSFNLYCYKQKNAIQRKSLVRLFTLYGTRIEIY